VLLHKTLCVSKPCGERGLVSQSFFRGYMKVGRMERTYTSVLDETEHTCRMLVLELHGKQALGRCNCRWEDNIKTEIVHFLFYDASIIKTL
jgi:hypothetical protein